MGALFNLNGKLGGFLSGIANLIILNLLWMLCCIPLITIVPATAAMYYVTLKMVRKEDPSILRAFFHSFRQNLKQGIILSIIVLLLTVAVSANIRILSNSAEEIHRVPLILSYGIGALACVTCSYICPLLSRFENTVSATVRNSTILALSHPLKSVIIAVLNLSPVLLLLFLTKVFIVTALFWFLLGFAAVAWINSLMINKIFAKYETAQETNIC